MELKDLMSAITDIAIVFNLTHKDVINILHDGLDIRYNNNPPRYFTELLYEAECEYEDPQYP